MRKKQMAILLMSVMILGVGSACGAEKTSEAKTEKTKQEETVKENDTEKTEDEKKTEDETVVEDEEETETVAFEEQTVIDNDVCTVKVTGIEPDSYGGFSVNTYYENKSAEKDCNFMIKSVAVNGVDCTPLLMKTVTPGKNANDVINLDTTGIYEYEIGEFTDMEITFRVYDEDFWDNGDIALETTHIYPYGEENAVKFEREPLDTDNVVVDNEYVKVTSIGYKPDDFWGYSAILYMENKTEVPVMFNINDAAVNGTMIDPFYSFTLAPGKTAFSSISWMESDFADNNITEVEEIEFSLTASNADEWGSDPFFNDIVILNP